MNGPSRGRLMALAAIAAGVLGACLAPVAGAAFPGPTGKIAFSEFGTGQIYAINPDGSGLLKLTSTSKKWVTGDPSWSPDGRKLIFSRFHPDDGTGARIWIMRADGSHQRRLAKEKRGFRAYEPGYTPDGSEIVYTRCKPDDGVCAIWKMRADGKRKRPLTPYVSGPRNEVVDFGTSVSPDGAQIAFGRLFAGGIVAQVYLMGIDGSSPQPITPPELEGTGADWSPDGDSIVFASRALVPGSNIYSTDQLGTAIARLTETPFPHNDYDAVYSPAGDQIAFISDRDSDDLSSELFVMNADGSGEQRIETGLSGVSRISWGSAPLTSD